MKPMLIATDVEDKSMIMSYLLCLRVNIIALLRWGGSTKGKKKDKDMHWMYGVGMLEANYFPNIQTHTPYNFRWCFMMNKELFIKI
jgi:hypothetical protein